MRPFQRIVLIITSKKKKITGMVIGLQFSSTSSEKFVSHLEWNNNRGAKSVATTHVTIKITNKSERNAAVNGDRIEKQVSRMAMLENDCQRGKGTTLSGKHRKRGEEGKGNRRARLCNDNVRGGTALVNSTRLKWHERGENSDRIARRTRYFAHTHRAAAVVCYYVHIYEVWPGKAPSRSC